MIILQKREDDYNDFLGVFDSVDNIPEKVFKMAEKNMVNKILSAFARLIGRSQRFLNENPKITEFQDFIDTAKQNCSRIKDRINNNSFLFNYDNPEDAELADWINLYLGEVPIYCYQSFELNKITDIASLKVV